MTSILPHALHSHIPLALFFEELGKRHFGQKWDGSEKNAVSIPSLKDARKMIVEEKDLTTKIKERFDQSDDKYLAYIEFLTDQEEYTLYQTDKKEYQMRAAVSRLIRLRETIRSLPDVENKNAYDNKYEAAQRKIGVELLIGELLANGQVCAYHRTDKGRQILPAEEWASTTVQLDPINSAVSIQGKSFIKLEFETKSVQDVIRRFPKDASRNKTHSRQAVLNELIFLIREYPAGKNKKYFETVLQEKFSGLSGRAFDKIWTEALEITGSNLGCAGRRPKT